MSEDDEGDTAKKRRRSSCISLREPSERIKRIKTEPVEKEPMLGAFAFMLPNMGVQENFDINKRKDFSRAPEDCWEELQRIKNNDMDDPLAFRNIEPDPDTTSVSTFKDLVAFMKGRLARRLNKEPRKFLKKSRSKHIANIKTILSGKSPRVVLRDILKYKIDRGKAKGAKKKVRFTIPGHSRLRVRYYRGLTKNAAPLGIGDGNCEDCGRELSSKSGCDLLHPRVRYKCKCGFEKFLCRNSALQHLRAVHKSKEMWYWCSVFERKPTESPSNDKGVVKNSELDAVDIEWKCQFCNAFTGSDRNSGYAILKHRLLRYGCKICRKIVCFGKTSEHLKSHGRTDVNHNFIKVIVPDGAKHINSIRDSSSMRPQQGFHVKREQDDKDSNQQAIEGLDALDASDVHRGSDFRILQLDATHSKYSYVENHLLDRSPNKTGNGSRNLEGIRSKFHENASLFELQKEGEPASNYLNGTKNAENLAPWRRVDFICDSCGCPTADIKKASDVYLHSVIRYKCGKCNDHKLLCSTSVKQHSEVIHGRICPDPEYFSVFEIEPAVSNMGIQLPPSENTIKIRAVDSNELCEECGFQSKFLRNIVFHRNWRYQCAYCGEAFCRVSFQKHLLSVHNRISTNFKNKDYTCMLNLAPRSKVSLVQFKDLQEGEDMNNGNESADTAEMGLSPKSDATVSTLQINDKRPKEQQMAIGDASAAAGLVPWKRVDYMCEKCGCSTEDFQLDHYVYLHSILLFKCKCGVPELFCNISAKRHARNDHLNYGANFWSQRFIIFEDDGTHTTDELIGGMPLSSTYKNERCTDCGESQVSTSRNVIHRRWRYQCTLCDELFCRTAVMTHLRKDHGRALDFYLAVKKNILLIVVKPTNMTQLNPSETTVNILPPIAIHSSQKKAMETTMSVSLDSDALTGDSFTETLLSESFSGNIYKTRPFDNPANELPRRLLGQSPEKVADIGNTSASDFLTAGSKDESTGLLPSAVQLPKMDLVPWKRVDYICEKCGCSTEVLKQDHYVYLHSILLFKCDCGVPELFCSISAKRHAKNDHFDHSISHYRLRFSIFESDGIHTIAELTGGTPLNNTFKNERCAVCGDSQLNTSMNVIHRRWWYQCTLCGELFCRTGIMTHLRLVHGRASNIHKAVKMNMLLILVKPTNMTQLNPSETTVNILPPNAIHSSQKKAMETVMSVSLDSDALPGDSSTETLLSVSDSGNIDKTEPFDKPANELPRRLLGQSPEKVADLGNSSVSDFLPSGSKEESTGLLPSAVQYSDEDLVPWQRIDYICEKCGCSTKDLQQDHYVYLHSVLLFKCDCGVPELFCSISAKRHAENDHLDHSVNNYRLRFSIFELDGIHTIAELTDGMPLNKTRKNERCSVCGDHQLSTSMNAIHRRWRYQCTLCGELFCRTAVMTHLRKVHGRALEFYRAIKMNILLILVKPTNMTQFNRSKTTVSIGQPKSAHRSQSKAIERAMSVSLDIDAVTGDSASGSFLSESVGDNIPTGTTAVNYPANELPGKELSPTQESVAYTGNSTASDFLPSESKEESTGRQVDPVQCSDENLVPWKRVDYICGKCGCSTKHIKFDHYVYLHSILLFKCACGDPKLFCSTSARTHAIKNHGVRPTSGGYLDFFSIFEEQRCHDEIIDDFSGRPAGGMTLKRVNKLESCAECGGTQVQTSMDVLHRHWRFQCRHCGELFCGNSAVTHLQTVHGLVGQYVSTFIKNNDLIIFVKPTSISPLNVSKITGSIWQDNSTNFSQRKSSEKELSVSHESEIDSGILLSESFPSEAANSLENESESPFSNHLRSNCEVEAFRFSIESEAEHESSIANDLIPSELSVVNEVETDRPPDNYSKGIKKEDLIPWKRVDYFCEKCGCSTESIKSDYFAYLHAIMLYKCKKCATSEFLCKTSARVHFQRVHGETDADVLFRLFSHRFSCYEIVTENNYGSDTDFARGVKHIKKVDTKKPFMCCLETRKDANLCVLHPRLWYECKMCSEVFCRSFAEKHITAVHGLQFQTTFIKKHFKMLVKSKESTVNQQGPFQVQSFQVKTDIPGLPEPAIVETFVRDKDIPIFEPNFSNQEVESPTVGNFLEEKANEVGNSQNELLEGAYGPTNFEFENMDRKFMATEDSEMLGNYEPTQELSVSKYLNGSVHKESFTPWKRSDVNCEVCGCSTSDMRVHYAYLHSKLRYKCNCGVPDVFCVNTASQHCTRVHKIKNKSRLLMFEKNDNGLLPVEKNSVRCNDCGGNRWNIALAIAHHRFRYKCKLCGEIFCFGLVTLHFKYAHNTQLASKSVYRNFEILENSADFALRDKSENANVIVPLNSDTSGPWDLCTQNDTAREKEIQTIHDETVNLDALIESHTSPSLGEGTEIEDEARADAHVSFKNEKETSPGDELTKSSTSENFVNTPKLIAFSVPVTNVPKISESSPKRKPQSDSATVYCDLCQRNVLDMKYHLRKSHKGYKCLLCFESLVYENKMLARNHLAQMHRKLKIRSGRLSYFTLSSMKQPAFDFEGDETLGEPEVLNCKANQIVSSPTLHYQEGNPNDLKNTLKSVENLTSLDVSVSDSHP